MTQCNTLQLSDWGVTDAAINTAYKTVAKGTHPDKLAEEEKLGAIEFMKMINTAKDVLLGDDRCQAYHKDGKLPCID